VIVDLQASDRWQAIDELIDHLVTAGKTPLINRGWIVAAVKKRELSMTTAIGYGIGIPHASTELVFDVIHILGRSKTGINFGVLDGKPVHRVVLFLVPAGQLQKHLHVLTNMAKLAQQIEL
jgi:mannitol/fructose-specific phosphotransferase system IIA component (Ntr-type)